VGLLCCVVAFAWWGVMRIDDRSLARQIRSVEIGLAEAIAEIPVEQDSSAIWDDAVVNLRANNEAWLAENLIEWMSEYYRHDYVYVLDRHNLPMRGASSGEKVEANSFEVFRRAIQPLVLQLRADMASVSGDREDSTSAITGLGIADFVTLPEQSVAAVSIRPVVPSSGALKQVPGEEYLHVSIKTIAEAFTRPIAARFSLRELQFVTAVPNSDRAWVAVRDRSYSLIGYMTWSPDRPASALVLDLLPAAGLSFAVGVTGLVLLLRRLRRTSAKLEVSEAQAQYLAFHDPLCGIPNRALFEDRLDQALAMMRRTKGKVALHFLDLDGFKHLNDTLGHAAGDELLCQVSKRLRIVIRETDTVARLGGDEFAIIQVDVAEQLGAERLAERIIASISEPFHLSGEEVRVGVSIGIVLTSEPDCAAADLRRKADIALYQAKANGRGRLQVFVGDMDDAVRQKQALERDLRLALREERGLRLDYQPIFSRPSSEVCGAEALLRWSHSELGQLRPDEFISLAEERGLIDQLGLWVLNSACRYAAKSSIPWVAVNVSPLQFRDDCFADRVLEILALTGLAPDRLEIEITEGLLLQNSPVVQATLTKLRVAGIRVALDDFGTGYSSISYLRTYGVDKLKIDRSFVEQLGQGQDIDSIVRSIIELARAMRMRVTAEGVETDLQRSILDDLGCDQLQGFLLARPISGDELERLLARTRTPALSAVG
jgi:diguanylate cyclase (GGDEF)-like protein